MCSYCRQFIPNCSQPERSRPDITLHRTWICSRKVTWTDAAKAFESLWKCLQRTPTLGIPDATKAFTQFVDNVTTAWLLSEGNLMETNSTQSGTSLTYLTVCLEVFLSACQAILASRDIVCYSPLTVYVPYCEASFLQEQKHLMQWLLGGSDIAPRTRLWS